MAAPPPESKRNEEPLRVGPVIRKRPITGCLILAGWGTKSNQGHTFGIVRSGAASGDQALPNEENYEETP
jgi:hypothetical protein